MSYVFARDNPEIANNCPPAATLESIRRISEHVDRLHARGMHEDLCACTTSGCATRANVELREAGSEETLAWLAAQGYLSISDVVEGLPAEARTPGGFPYRQHPAEFAGSNPDRQSVGDPGHCEDCCSVGHVAAHPEFGCGDVGCYRTHGPDA